MIRFYRLEISGEVRDVGASNLYRWERCEKCGDGTRVQVRNLDVRRVVEQPVTPPVATTLGGELIASREVARAMAHAAIEFDERPICMSGTHFDWVQILPSISIPVSDAWLQRPFKECPSCGGCAVLAGTSFRLDVSGPTNALATARGLPQVIVYSDEFVRVVGGHQDWFCGPSVSGRPNPWTEAIDWSEL